MANDHHQQELFLILWLPVTADRHIISAILKGVFYCRRLHLPQSTSKKQICNLEQHMKSLKSSRFIGMWSYLVSLIRSNQNFSFHDRMYHCNRVTSFLILWIFPLSDYISLFSHYFSRPLSITFMTFSKLLNSLKAKSLAPQSWCIPDYWMLGE